MREGSYLYTVFSIYAVLISWYYNHDIMLAIFHYIIGPWYIFYELLMNHLSHGLWRSIPLSYFN
jgi:hypothetical protein